MSNGQVARETRGVVSEVLASLDLGPEIAGMEGRQLRMRMFTFEPGAVFGPIHDHNNRPGVVYVNRGTAPAVEISVDISGNSRLLPDKDATAPHSYTLVQLSGRRWSRS